MRLAVWQMDCVSLPNRELPEPAATQNPIVPGRVWLVGVRWGESGWVRQGRDARATEWLLCCVICNSLCDGVVRSDGGGQLGVS